MEVVEHVDNPAGFLRSCAELVKVRPRRVVGVRALIYRLISLGLAWRTSFPLDDCTDAALLSSFDRCGREGASPR